MPKYKRLSPDELQKLEKEFIEFLIINGITAEDWELIKKEEVEKAERIIDLFSEVVYEQTLRETQFLKAVTKERVYCFQCQADRFLMVGMKVRPDQDFDFRRVAYLDDFLVNHASEVHLFTGEKMYQDNRQQEIFNMLESGAEISDGRLFKSLSLLYAQSQKPV